VQLPSYQANLARFEANDAQVVGISIDSRHANRAWAESLGGFSFPLLSDFYPHGAVAEAYGVLRNEGMAERAVFIIDKSGTVRYIDVHDLGEQPDEEQIFDELAKLA
jgi:peroxiredoxin